MYFGLAAAGSLVFAGWLLFWRRRAIPTPADALLLDAIIERQSPKSSRHSKAPLAPAGAGLAALEGHLRTAILDPTARERLISAAQASGRDRAAAIRKVLSDLQQEDKRWS
jgi:hypothetical protein